MTEGDNAMDKAMEKGHSMSLMTEGLTTPARWQCKDCQAQLFIQQGGRAYGSALTKECG